MVCLDADYADCLWFFDWLEASSFGKEDERGYKKQNCYWFVLDADGADY